MTDQSDLKLILDKLNDLEQKLEILQQKQDYALNLLTPRLKTDVETALNYKFLDGMIIKEEYNGFDSGLNLSVKDVISKSIYNFIRFKGRNVKVDTDTETVTINYNDICDIIYFDINCVSREEYGTKYHKFRII